MVQDARGAHGVPNRRRSSHVVAVEIGVADAQLSGVVLELDGTILLIGDRREQAHHRVHAIVVTFRNVVQRDQRVQDNDIDLVVGDLFANALEQWGVNLQVVVASGDTQGELVAEVRKNCPMSSSCGML